MPRTVSGRSLHKLLGERADDVRAINLPSASVALDLRSQRAVVLPSPKAAGALGGASTASGVSAPPGFNNIATMIDAARRQVPLAVAFSRWDIFVRPNAGAIAEGSGVQAGGDTWLWLDVGELDPDRTTSLVAPTPALMLPPHVLVRLLKGALTGSVKRLGTDDVDGVPTTHLRFNIDRDKAAKDLDDDDEQRLKRLFESDGIDGTFYDDAEAWIDGDGVARRISITLPQRIDSLTSFDLTYRLELTGRRSEPLPLPTNEQLAEVPTLPELLPGSGA